MAQENIESDRKLGLFAGGVQSFIQKAESMFETILLQVNREQHKSDVVVSQGVPENLCFGFPSYSISAHVPECAP